LRKDDVLWQHQEQKGCEYCKDRDCKEFGKPEMCEENGQIRLEMKKENIRHGTEFYSVDFRLCEWGVWHYRFEAETQDGRMLYFGKGEDGCAVCGEWLPEWQLTVIKHNFRTPDWAKGGLIYHIFADRFYRGSDRKPNFPKTFHENWYELPVVREPYEEYLANDFFGGDFEGIISKLDYIKSLGATAIYLSPIFESASNHRYDTGDYLKIDGLLGDEQMFARLIKESKERGIELILDGVFNHSGSDSVYFNKAGNYDSLGAYQSQNSPYYDWYYFEKFPDKYHCWWGCTVVPTLNKSNPEYRKLIFGENGVIKKWTGMGVKGWRLDVVDELPSDFVEQIRKTVKEADSEALIIGEVWENATTKISYDTWRPYLFGDQLDGVMNYPFKEAVLAFALDGNVKMFKGRVSEVLQTYPKQSLDVLMNILDSHDTVRVLNALSEYAIDGTTKRGRAAIKIEGEYLKRAKERLKIAAVLQYTLPGVPCLYYGDEAGVTGYEDPLNRATYPWGREDAELLEFYRRLGAIRAQLSEEMRGETMFAPDDDLLIMKRTQGKNQLTVIVNNTAENLTKKISEDCVDLFSGDTVLKGNITVPACGFLILKPKADEGQTSA
jgi:cyclomaltodextrinase